MGRFSHLGWMLAVLLLQGAEAIAQEPIAWESNLERAQKTAAQTNRLVLVHFWAPWCGPCQRMNAEVFSQPEVARQIQANYVPVKINADRSPDIAKKFGVDGLPTDVVMTPQGQVVNVTKKRADAAQYVGHLNQLAAAYHQQNAGVLASLPAGSPGAIANQPPMQPPAGVMPPNPAFPGPVMPQSANPSPAYGQSLSLNGPANGMNTSATGMPPAASPPNAMPNLVPPNNYPQGANANIDNAVASLTRNPSAAPEIPSPNVLPNNGVQPPSGNPPLALDGCCPVMLVEKQQWVRGDKRWGALHQGRTYLFTGPEEQRRFLANFDRYAPVISGNDIVLAAEEQKAVPGFREHGVFYANHIFLFSSEATLQKFSSNPDYFANQALGTLRQAASAGQQPR